LIPPKSDGVPLAAESAETNEHSPPTPLQNFDRFPVYISIHIFKPSVEYIFEIAQLAQPAPAKYILTGHVLWEILDSHKWPHIDGYLSIAKFIFPILTRSVALAARV